MATKIKAPDIVDRLLFKTNIPDEVEIDRTHTSINGETKYLGEYIIYGRDPIIEWKILGELMENHTDFYVNFKTLMETYIMESGVLSWDVFKNNYDNLAAFIERNHGRIEYKIFKKMNYLALRDLTLVYSAIEFILKSTRGDTEAINRFHWFLLAYTLPSFHFLRFVNDASLDAKVANKVPVVLAINELIAKKEVPQISAYYVYAKIMNDLPNYLNTDFIIPSLDINNPIPRDEFLNNHERAHYEFHATGGDPLLIKKA